MSSDPCLSDVQPPPRTAADSDGLLRALLAHAVEASGAEYGVILLTGSMQRLLLPEGIDATPARAAWPKAPDTLLGAALSSRVLQLRRQTPAGRSSGIRDPRMPTGAAAALPLVAAGDVLGAVLLVRAARHSEFSGRQLEAARIACQWISSTAALGQALALRSAQLRLARVVANAVSSAQTIEQALRVATSSLSEIIGYRGVAATMVDGASSEQVLVEDLQALGTSLRGMRRPIGEGVVGKVIASRAQMLLDRAPDHPLYRWPGPTHQQSLIVTPIVIDDECVAVIELGDVLPERFGVNDAALMRTVADQIAAALRGVRLREAAGRRAMVLALAGDVAKQVASARDADEALRCASQIVFERTGYSSVASFRALPDEDAHVVVDDLLREGKSYRGLRRKLLEGTAGRVFATGQQLSLSPDDSTDDGSWPGACTFNSVLATPVMVDGTCEAVLGVYDEKKDRFDADDAMLMATVAEQVGAAMRGAGLRAESEQRARRLEQLEANRRELLARLVRAQEEERSSVAADLHDDTIQVMSACVLSLDRVQRAIDQGDTVRARATLIDAAGLMAGAVERTRRMTFELRPAVLWENGLVPAVRQLLRSIEGEGQVAVGLSEQGLDRRLDPATETIAFRSIAELIANARKHSAAARVDVAIRLVDELLEVEVTDDGRGFHLESALRRARETNHLGLEALTGRLQAAGGQATIETSPGRGTTVRLVLPARVRD
jgi:signal transduction histidine kinase